MPKVHLVEGPVGAGKSTFSKSLALRTNGVHIALDEWFVRLYSADRPATNFMDWYVERKARLLELIWSHSSAVLSSDTDVVLELGLIQRQGRISFYEKVKGAGIELKVYVLDAPKDVRLERVMRRNLEKGETFSMIVPEQIFEIANNMWEAPGESECSSVSVEYVTESLQR